MTYIKLIKYHCIDFKSDLIKNKKSHLLTHQLDLIELEDLMKLLQVIRELFYVSLIVFNSTC